MSIVDTMISDLHLDRETIYSIANGPEAHYRAFMLGKRRIDALRPALKLLQTWIHDFVREETEELPAFITAYEKESSIRKNAELHHDKEHLLCIDIESFFASCSTAQIASVFAAIKVSDSPTGHKRFLTDAEIQLLTCLSSYRGSLSVGAPSSPIIANRIMHPIDLRIIAALGPSFVYSRYSDDICLSSHSWIDVEEALGLVNRELQNYGFRLNESKTRCCGRGNARRITGVYITPEGKLSIGSKRKRDLKSRLYQYLVRGEGRADELLGLVNFCALVEPRYVSALLAKYASYGSAVEHDGAIGALKAGL